MTIAASADSYVTIPTKLRSEEAKRLDKAIMRHADQGVQDLAIQIKAIHGSCAAADH